mmetsp:Transcript_19395/g.29775  ORF Transcript_19395/g.29775 Transcript_19395/m.29775 type:complete len:135 (+) Transcript_19395:1461-1865(+)
MAMLPDRSTKSVRHESKNPLLTGAEKMDKFLDKLSQGNAGRNKKAATEAKPEDPNLIYENFVKEQKEAKDNQKQLQQNIKVFEKKQNKLKKEVTKINPRLVSIPGEMGFEVANTRKTQGASPVSNFYCKGYTDE